MDFFLEVGMTADEVQYCLEKQGGDGLCLLETGVAGEETGNVLAMSPSEVYRGKIHRAEDRMLLRDVLREQRGRVAAPASGVAGAGLYGWIGYDGGFVLGRYDEVRTWSGVRGTRGVVQAGGGVGLRAMVGPQEYERVVERALDYIGAGDIYQVNLARQFRGVRVANQYCFHWLSGLYENVRNQSPVPYGALVSLGGTTLISASPECFLRMEGRRIETRPIKGTRLRQHGVDSDVEERQSLLCSEKERAELLMITDLERNDLGRSCEFGSVRVRDYARIESYAYLHHMVSRVDGLLRVDTDHVEALAAAFPGGSITGAPKSRAMDIIAELEGFSRGAYTGAIGWFGAHGFSQFSVAIRTFECCEDVVLLHTGSGIVADSKPVAERRETMTKARALFSAIGSEWSFEG